MNSLTDMMNAGLRVFTLDEWEALRDARIAASPAIQAHYAVLAAFPEGHFRTRPRTPSKQALLEAMAEARAEQEAENAQSVAPDTGPPNPL